MADQDIMRDLGLRALACSGFRWMAGMRSTTGWIVFENDGQTVDVIEVLTGELDCDNIHHKDAALALDNRDALEAPDMSDPATLGCFVSLCRELTGESKWGSDVWDPLFLVERLEAHHVHSSALSDPSSNATSAEGL